MPNPIDDLFPDLDRHHPDCSDVTDAELSNAILSHWPIKEGVSTIPYSLSETPFWASLVFPMSVSSYLPEKVTLDTKKLMKERIRFGFDKWTNASNGTLQFVEDNNINPYSPGIFFYVGGSEQHFKETSDNTKGAFTVRRLGFDGKFIQSYIFFPNDQWFWNTSQIEDNDPAWTINTPEHEQGHALGFNHLHEYADIQSKLQNTPDGVYCSVMPYPDLISTYNSMCQTHCEPNYAVYPAALDSRMIQLTHHLSINYFAKEMIISYGINFVDAFFIPIFIIGSYNITASFVSNLTPYRNKNIIPEKIAYFIADSGLTSGLIYLNFPMWVPGLYVATSLTKFIPEKYYDKMPTPAKKLLISHYNFYTLFTSIAYIQNYSFFAILLTAGLSSGAIRLGVWLTNGSHNIIGKKLAAICNKIPQAITSRNQKASQQEQRDVNSPEEKSINVTENKPEEPDLINSGRCTLFHSKPSRPTPTCGRLMNWLCRKTYQPVVADNDIENNVKSLSLATYT